MIYTLTRHYKWFATSNLKSFHLLLFINFTLLAFSTLFFFAKNTTVAIYTDQTTMYTEWSEWDGILKKREIQYTIFFSLDYKMLIILLLDNVIKYKYSTNYFQLIPDIRIYIQFFLIIIEKLPSCLNLLLENKYGFDWWIKKTIRRKR